MSVLNKLRALGTGAAVAAFVFLLINSASVAVYSRKYLTLCGERVIPSLFVFSVLGSFIAASGFFTKLCRAVPRFGTEIGLTALSLCAGFPLGTIITTELYESGAVSKRQAEYLCTFSSTPSLAFILSYTADTLNSKTLGLQLALLTLAASVLSAVLFRFILLNKSERYIKPRVTENQTKSFVNCLTDCCGSAVIICGCVIFFGVIGSLLPSKIGAFAELSYGISLCTAPSEAAALLGFSGISVICQTAAACKGKLNIFPYVASKVFQCIFMWSIARIFIDG